MDSRVITQKKIGYLKGLFLHDSLEDKYPQFYNMLEHFFFYLDENVNDNNENFFAKLVNIDDNIDSDKIYDELLEDFYSQYFKLLPSEDYLIPDDTKKKLLSYGKWINNSKGTRNIFDFIFNYLSNFDTLNESGDVVSIKNLIYSIFEEQPFTYRINVNQEISHIQPLLEDLNIAGFSSNIRKAISWGGGSSGGNVQVEHLDSVDDLPEVGEIGDIYIIDDESWVWNGNEWENYGDLGEVGKLPADSIRKLKITGNYTTKKRYIFADNTFSEGKKWKHLL